MAGRLTKPQRRVMKRISNFPVCFEDLDGHDRNMVMRLSDSGLIQRRTPVYLELTDEGYTALETPHEGDG